MKHLIQLYLLVIIISLGFTSCNSKEEFTPYKRAEISLLKGFPKSENGYELGVSAAYAGLIGDELLLVGGCNFPETPAADGGVKQFYKGIYAVNTHSTDSENLDWRKVGDLPECSAYGVSVVTENGLVCVGGSNSKGAHNRVWQISLEGDTASVLELPSLPWGIDNMAGTIYKNKITLVGGSKGGNPTSQVLSLDLNNLTEGWVVLEDFPGNRRTQSIAFASNDSLFVWGGFAGSTSSNRASLNVDGILLNENHWHSLPSPNTSNGEALSLGGATVVNLDNGYFVAMGGVNKTIFLEALQREELMKSTTDSLLLDDLRLESKFYMNHEPDWYQFNSTVLLYSTKNREWIDLGLYAETARAGAIAVKVKENLVYLLGGELKPGVRTPHCVAITLK